MGPTTNNGYTIIDVRPRDGTSVSDPDALKSTLIAGLQKPHNEKELSSLILYDEAGLKLFEKITYLPEYYLTNREIDLLLRAGHHIAGEIPDGAFIIELGAGALRKTTILLDILEKQQKHVSYFALDLDRAELHRTLQEITPRYRRVSLFGLHGTYDDGREWIARQPEAIPKMLLWLGSSIGNMGRAEAGDFIGSFGRVLSPNDRFFVAIDSRNNDPENIRKAYNDETGITAQFALNGLKNFNAIFGDDAIQTNNFSYYPFYNEVAARNEAYYISHCDQEIRLGLAGRVVRIRRGELIKFAMSCKYDAVESQVLSEVSGAELKKSWSDAEGCYFLHMLCWNDVDQKKLAVPF